MEHINTFIAAFPAYPSIGENIWFIGVGFAFVIIVLLMLGGLTQLIGLAFKKNDQMSVASATKKLVDMEQVPVPVTVDSATTDNSAITAVIVAAAVHAVIGDRPHRIISIRPTEHGWAQEGRRTIFSSHHVR